MLRFLPAAALAAVAALALTMSAGAAMSPVSSAKLTGAKEVPAKGDPDASGIVILHLSTTKKNVCWDFKNMKNLARASAAHIHKGAAGKAGPVVVGFGKTYKAKGCVSASVPVIEAIETHPNRYYVNVHNARYPAGAIRGNLAAGMLGG